MSSLSSMAGSVFLLLDLGLGRLLAIGRLRGSRLLVSGRLGVLLVAGLLEARAGSQQQGTGEEGDGFFKMSS
jgi:hypothetical protein